MWWVLMTSLAGAGDLTGWEGQPWGSTKGGPNDPAATALYAAGISEIGKLFLTRTSADSKFTTIKVTNPSVVYLENQLAGAIFTTDDPTVLPTVTTAMGEPFVATGNRYFQNQNVSVWMQPYGGGWLVNVVSLPHRARCVEMYSGACQLAETRVEAEMRVAKVDPSARAAWDSAAEERRREQEKALAVQKIRIALAKLCSTASAAQECKDAVGALAVLEAGR